MPSYSRRKFLASTSAAAVALALSACGDRSDAPAAPQGNSGPGPDPAQDPASPAPEAGAGMEPRPLGRSGIAIAPFVLGTNVFGWTAGRERSFDLLDRFVDAGFQAVDTADSYSGWVDGNEGGESETIIGEWIESRGRRDDLVLITKVGSEFRGQRGLSAAHIERSVEGSLQRLKTDVIDVYFSHFPDPDTPQEETLAAYQRLIEAGKVRSIGASNFSIEQLREALALSEANGLPRYEVLQPRYNLYDRGDLDGPMLDLAQSESLGVITYSALASGFLSGKYRSEADLEQSPRGRGIARYLDDRGLRILAALDDVAARHGAEPADVALAWVVAREGVTAPIASATSLGQLDTLLRAPALAHAFTAQDMQQLDEASAA